MHLPNTDQKAFITKKEAPTPTIVYVNHMTFQGLWNKCRSTHLSFLPDRSLKIENFEFLTSVHVVANIRHILPPKEVCFAESCLDRVSYRVSLELQSIKSRVINHAHDLPRIGFVLPRIPVLSVRPESHTPDRACRYRILRVSAVVIVVGMLYASRRLDLAFQIYSCETCIARMAEDSLEEDDRFLVRDNYRKVVVRIGERSTVDAYLKMIRPAASDVPGRDIHYVLATIV